MSNAFSLKAGGIYCCLLLLCTGCRSDKPSAAVTSSASDCEQYEQKFLLLDQELRSGLNAVRPLVESSSLDSNDVRLFKSVEKKADFYHAQTKNELSKYKALLGQGERSQLSEAVLNDYKAEYKTSFQSMEEGYRQMQEVLKTLQQKSSH